MKNKNGFTLMELLVALFLSSMVTIALVSMWRAASIQTSQGQRQAIVRNNMSIFLRSLYKDLTEADVILYPNAQGSSTNVGLLLMSGYNMKRIGGGDTSTSLGYVAVGRVAGDPIFQESVIRSYYFDSTNHRICLNENKQPFGGDLVGTTNVIGESIINEIVTLEDMIDGNDDNNSENCGKVVMDNVNSASISLLNNNNSTCSTGDTCDRYKVSINIFRNFGGNSVPVSINFERIFVAAGGV